MMSGGVRAYALDPERAKALWALSEEMVGERSDAGRASVSAGPVVGVIAVTRSCSQSGSKRASDAALAVGEGK